MLDQTTKEGKKVRDTTDVATSQSEMRIRDYLSQLEQDCPAVEHQKIAYNWMVTALGAVSIAIIEGGVILYLLWR
jgi:hypothetical protein